MCKSAMLIKSTHFVKVILSYSCACECSKGVGPPPGCWKIVDCNRNTKSWEGIISCNGINGCPNTNHGMAIHSKEGNT